jgi:hypothetical protein
MRDQLWLAYSCGGEALPTLAFDWALIWHHIAIMATGWLQECNLALEALAKAKQ